MTGPERAYRERLFILKAAGEIRDYKYEPDAILLDFKTQYTPDFRVVLADGTVRIVEVKAARRTKKRKIARPFFKSRDSYIRLRWSSQLHPEWQHVLTWYDPDKGTWAEEII